MFQPHSAGPISLQFQGVLPALGAGGVYSAVHSLDQSISVKVQAHRRVPEGGYLSAFGAWLSGPDAMQHEGESRFLMPMQAFSQRLARGLGLPLLRKQFHGLPAGP